MNPDYEEIDSQTWFGLKFPGLDVPHQLPFLTGEELAQETPKVTIPLEPGRSGIGAEV